MPDIHNQKAANKNLLKDARNRVDGLAMLKLLEEENLINSDKAALMRKVIQPQDWLHQSAVELIASKKLPHAIIPGKILDLDFLCRWLATKAELQYFTIDPLKVDVSAVTEVMSYAYAQHSKVLPVEVRETYIVIATVEPFQLDWSHEIARITNKEIRLVITNPEAIRRYQVEFYNLAKSVHHAKAQHHTRTGELQNLEQLMQLGENDNLDANNQNIVRIVDWLLQYAFEQRASDIHIEPRRSQGNVRFRIDGVLHKVYEMPSAVTTAVTSRIKILARMDIAEKRRPQDGRIKTRDKQQTEIEMRLSTMPTAFGEKLVMRIFDPETVTSNFIELGFGKQDETKWQDMIKRPHGIILVTGPTGSGKTTTLYSSLGMLASPEVNVCTIEDPIENLDGRFNQMQVQHNIELDFAAGVRTLLRQDPDIIMIGEIRDLETAQMAVQASLTGHLVLSTLHTNDATAAIMRLIEIGIPHYLINATLLGVMAQRLVRILCSECKRAVPVDENHWLSLVNPWKVKPPKEVFEPVGCLNCRQTGFRGRQGLFEIFTMNSELQKLNTANFDIQAFRHKALQQGMSPLRISGAQKIAAGLTTIAEVMKVAPPEMHH